MADLRIKDLASTASTTAGDDYFAVDGTTNGTRKLSASSPSFSGDLSADGDLTIGGAGSFVGDVTFNDGTPVSAIANARSPRQGLLFDGSAGATVASPYILPANLGTGAFTLAVWVRFDATGSQFLVSGATNGVDLYRGGDDKLYLERRNAGGVTIAASTSALTWTTGKWYFVAATRTGSTVVLSINGVEIPTTISSGAENISGETKYIGYKGDTSNNYLTGAAIVTSYNRALSASEVTALFESGQVSGADINSASNTAYFSSDFSSSSGWTTDGSTTISGGKLNLAANDQAYYSGLNFPSGSKIRVTITVDSLAAGNVEVYAGNGSWTTIASGAGTASAEVTTQVHLTTLNIRAGGAAVVDNVYVYKLGALLAPDAAQPGSGSNWYDTSGNNATISWTTGVQWAVPSSGDIYKVTSHAGGSNYGFTAVDGPVGGNFRSLASSLTTGWTFGRDNVSTGDYVIVENGTVMDRTASSTGNKTFTGTVTANGTGTHSFAGPIQAGAVVQTNVSSGSDAFFKLNNGDALWQIKNTGTTGLLDLIAGGTSRFAIPAAGVGEYADNAAAVTAGLAVGTIYRTGDVLKIVH